jgi:hypothetical protein
MMDGMRRELQVKRKAMQHTGPYYPFALKVIRYGAYVGPTF